MKPSYGKNRSTPSIQKSLRLFNASTTTCWPWRARLWVWSSTFWSIMPRVAAWISTGSWGRSRALGGGDHEGVGAIDRHVHVDAYSGSRIMRAAR